MSLPTNLQNGLSISDYGVITTPNQPIDLDRNSLIASGSSSPVIDAINSQLRDRTLQQYRFPLDLPKYNFTIIQHASLANPAASAANILQFMTSGFRREIGNVTAVYRLPLPTRLVDSHQTNFAEIAPLNTALNLAKYGFGAFKTNRIASVAKRLRENKVAQARMKRNKRRAFQSLARDGQKKTQLTDEDYMAEATKEVEHRYKFITESINNVENSGGIINTIGALSGIKIQNAKVVSITDPEFRTFALSWNFIPKSYRESLEIQKICYNLRKNMTPVRVDALSYITVFPAVYTMFFQPNVQFLYKFKPCVLTSISVDYKGGSGVPAFYKPQNENDLQSSPPESIILNTTWLELDYFVQQHYERDHTPEDLPSNDPYGLLQDSFTFRT